MQKLIPISIETYDIIIHPLRLIDMPRLENIEKDLYEILSDFENTLYIPRRRLKDMTDASHKIMGVILSYEKNLQYAHFITNKMTNKIIGLVDIISPEKAKENYKLEEYDWLVEYFLHKDFWGQGIMSGIISAICQKLNEQGIETIAAICDRNNIASIRILEKNGFEKTKPFDFKQDYYISKTESPF